MRHIKSFGSAVALSAALALFASTPSRADVVSVALQFNGGALSNVTNLGPGGSLVVPGFNGVWNVSVSAQGQTFLGGPGQPSILNSNAINASSAAASTLTVYVTSQNLLSPSGLVNFLSGFTSNFINGPLTVVEQTFLDTANGLFTGTAGGTVHLLGSSGNFVGPGLDTASVLTALSTTIPYSVTEVFRITSTGTGIGNTNDTINLSGTSVVPLPGALPLFAGGLVGLWALGRRRRKHATV